MWVHRLHRYLLLRAPNGKRLHIFFRLCGVEHFGLAQEKVMFGRVLRRRLIAQGLHNLATIGGQINLFGDLLVVHIAFDIAPALHLGENPDRHGLPGKGVESIRSGTLRIFPKPSGNSPVRTCSTTSTGWFKKFLGAMAFAISLRLEAWCAYWVASMIALKS